MKLPRCQCGREGMAYRPGDEASYGPDGDLIEPARPIQAWCLDCAVDEGFFCEGGAPVAERPEGLFWKGYLMCLLFVTPLWIAIIALIRMVLAKGN